MTRPLRVTYEYTDEYGNRLYVQQSADGDVTITITPTTGTVAEVEIPAIEVDDLAAALT